MASFWIKSIIFIHQPISLYNTFPMDLRFTTRRFYPDEQRILKTLKTQKEKEGSKIKGYHFIIAAMSGAGFTYFATLVGKDDFWVLPLGILAVFSFAFIVFTPYEIYKRRKRNKQFLQELTAFIDKGTVDTCTINAKRIAIAKEYEDEGDLYIIEYDTDKILYLWDNDYTLQKKFPCLDFELYDQRFYNLLGRVIYPLSEKIQPIVIDRKAKWKYMSEVGAAGHMDTERKNFDQLVEEYNKYA